MKNLRAATKGVLQQVEDRTGRSVQFMRDDSLKVMATFQMARNGASFHTLRYRPTDEPIDYLVVHQAAFVLRLYENEADQRFDFSPRDSAADLMSTLISGGRPLAPADAQALPGFAKFTAQWTMMNLRSLAVGMRVDAWIDSTMPELREAQQANLATQQQENAASLSFRQGGLSLPRMSVSMVAAYALFVDRLCGMTGFAVPYRAAGFTDLGTRFLQAWDSIDSAATRDIELIDRWAAMCGLSGHYDWIPFSP
jgi:hypothetical protein